MLSRIKEPSGPKTISNVPFVAVVAASLAHRCRELNPSIKELRSSVMTQILSTDTILQHHAQIYEGNKFLHDILSRMETVKERATTCQDAVSFGQMMSWLRVERVLCIRLYIFDSSLLQLFAFICEGMRLKGTTLPPALEDIFSDQRISDFLFLDGRPKTLDDCERGVEMWADPRGMLGRLKVTQHIFSKRCKPTVAQQILEGQGRMTGHLNGKPLEERLNWELNPPDPVRLEGILISAVCGVANKKLDTAGTWSYLRTKVFVQPTLQKKLLSKFLVEYVRSG